MPAKALLTKLVEHELLMAQLYRTLSQHLPERTETLLQLAVEEEGHADMLRHVRDAFLADGLIGEDAIEASAVQIDHQDAIITRMIVQVDGGTFREHDIIDEILRLECDQSELEINRIVMENRERPAFKVFAEILDQEEAHGLVLRDW